MAATLIPSPELQFCDLNGVPLAGVTLDCYSVGTLVHKDTFRDVGGVVANTNPIILDSAGRCIIYGNGAYRLILKDHLGNQIWDQQSAAMITEVAAPAALGFTPVQQGGGVGQNTSKVFIGNTLAGPSVTIDVTDFGAITFNNNLNALVTSLGFVKGVTINFTPVQQGGGINQLLNKVFLGHSNSGPAITVDTTDFGPIQFHNALDADINALYGTPARQRSGVQILPGGFVLQWGFANLPTGNGDFINFPITFPRGVQAIIGSSASSALPVIAVALVTPSTFQAWSGSRASSVTPTYLPFSINWAAIGF